MKPNEISPPFQPERPSRSTSSIPDKRQRARPRRRQGNSSTPPPNIRVFVEGLGADGERIDGCGSYLRTASQRIQMQDNHTRPGAA